MLFTLCRLCEWPEFEHLPKATQKVASRSMTRMALVKRSFEKRCNKRDCPKEEGCPRSKIVLYMEVPSSLEDAEAGSSQLCVFLEDPGHLGAKAPISNL